MTFHGYFLADKRFFTAIESMLAWVKNLYWFNTVSYMVEFMRMVLLKGRNFFDILNKLGVLFRFGCILNTLAIWNYRKSSGKI